MKLNKKEIMEFSGILEKIIREFKSSSLRKSGPDYQECNLFLDTFNKHNLIKQIIYLKKLINPIGKLKKNQVLEVGSGYGLNLIILKFLGFENVTGIEIVKSINYNANLLIDVAKKHCKLNLENCRSILGDAESTNFSDEEFDLVLSIEVISHVPSFDRFIREINRILKSSSYLIISDANNCSCPYYYKKRKAIWKRIRSQELNKRLKFLKENFPQIDPHFCASIALHTELLSKEAVKEIVPQIIKSGKLPMNLYFEGYAPVFFETGIWDEYGFSPRKLIKDLKKYGFSSKIDIALGSSRGFPFDKIEKTINFFPLIIKEKLRQNFICYSKKETGVKYLI